MTPQPEIFYVLNSRWPTTKAYGIQVAKVCQGFKQARAKVRLIIPMRARHAELKGQDPFELYGVTDRFRLIRLPSLDFTRLHLNGRVFFYVQQFLFACLTSLYLLPKRGVIYSRDPFVLYLLSFFRSALFWEVHRMPEHPNSRMYRRLFRSVRGVVAITRAIKDALIASGVPESLIHIAPDGIDIREMQSLPSGPELQQSLGLNPKKHIVGYVGQLLEWKGVDTLVRAAQLLDDRFRVFVVGGTPADVEKLRAMDIGHRVLWVGFLPHAQALRWISAANTVVLPNRKDGGISEHYTSPLKMFEYMAAGKRIVASDLPSIREVLNERNAILVTPDDPHALADGIQRSADDEMESKGRAERARSDVAQYAWDKRGAHVLLFIASSI